jgi:hypothetical protein
MIGSHPTLGKRSFYENSLSIGASLLFEVLTESSLHTLEISVNLLIELSAVVEMSFGSQLEMQNWFPSFRE